MPSLLAFFIPERPAAPPCASSAEKKLALIPSLKIIAKSREFWTIFVLVSLAHLNFPDTIAIPSKVKG